VTCIKVMNLWVVILCSPILEELAASTLQGQGE
jgi:hypothetical protein